MRRGMPRLELKPVAFQCAIHKGKCISIIRDQHTLPNCINLNEKMPSHGKTAAG
jgi:hypothetical protein